MPKNPQLDSVSYHFSELIHNWGFKRIHGRIWSRLFLSSRPLDAADLIEHLGISKALVSISLRELLNVKAVEEVGRSARGTNLFRANTDIAAIYLEVLKHRERQMIEQTSAALSALAKQSAADLNASDVSATQISTLSEHLEYAMTLLNAYVSANDKQESKPQTSPAAVAQLDSVVSFASPTPSSSSHDPSSQFKSHLELAVGVMMPARGG